MSIKINANIYLTHQNKMNIYRCITTTPMFDNIARVTDLSRPPFLHCFLFISWWILLKIYYLDISISAPLLPRQAKILRCLRLTHRNTFVTSLPEFV